jgi:hypothetical protein
MFQEFQSFNPPDLVGGPFKTFNQQAKAGIVVFKRIKDKG